MRESEIAYVKHREMGRFIEELGEVQIRFKSIVWQITLNKKEKTILETIT